MKKVLLLRALTINIFLPLFLFGQGSGLKWKVHFQNEVTSYSIDTEKNVYLGFASGSLRKFRVDGTENAVFSLPNQSSITLVEAQNNRKIFLFYRDIQQVIILDRFSAVPKTYEMRDFGIEYAQSACISPDGTFWTVENNPQRLKKIDPLRNVIIHEVQHELGDSINFMKTNGNLLLIIDENGLQILDQFGNLNGSIKVDKANYLQLLNNEVLLTCLDGIIRIDPYKIDKLDELFELRFFNKSAVMKLKEGYIVIDQRSLSLNPD